MRFHSPKRQDATRIDIDTRIHKYTTETERVERKLRENIYPTSICWTVCSQHVMSHHIANNCVLKFLTCPFICTGSIFLASFLHGHVDTFHLHIAYLPALHIFNTQQARWIRTFIRFLGRSASGQVQIQHRHQQQLHQPNLGRRVTGWRLGEKSRNFRWDLETSYCTTKKRIVNHGWWTPKQKTCKISKDFVARRHHHHISSGDHRHKPFSGRVLQPRLLSVVFVTTEKQRLKRLRRAETKSFNITFFHHVMFVKWKPLPLLGILCKAVGRNKLMLVDQSQLPTPAAPNNHSEFDLDGIVWNPFRHQIPTCSYSTTYLAT